MDLGAAVRDARKAVGLTQAGVAKLAGTSRQAIILLEQNGGRVATLCRVAPHVTFRIAELAAGDVFHVQVARARRRRGLSQAELAELAGLSLPTVKGVEAGGGSVASLSAMIGALAPSARRRIAPKTHWARASDVRFTPPEILAAIEEALGPISMDPCHDARSLVRAERALDVNDDGLSTHWSGRLAFVNPPFSSLSTWIRRCAEAWQSHEIEIVVGLFPVRTETAAFHECVVRSADVLMLRDKVRYLDEQCNRMSIAPFASMLCVWGAGATAVRQLAARLGAAVFWAAACEIPALIPLAHSSSQAI